MTRLISLTDDELAWASQALTSYAARLPDVPEPVLTLLGKLHGPGNHATLDDLRRHLPPRWYVSPTGRKLKSRDADETPITPKRYDAAKRAALADAGRRALGATP